MISKIVTSIPVTYDTFHKPGLNMIQCLILQLINTYDDGIGTEVSNKVIANFFSISTRTVSSSMYCCKTFTITHFEIKKVSHCPFCGREGIVEIDWNRLL